MSMTEPKSKSFSALINYFLLNKGPLASTTLEGLAFLYDDDTRRDSGKGPDMQFHFHSTHGYQESQKNEFGSLQNHKNEIIDMLFTAPLIPESFIMLPTLLHPKSSGSIRLKSNDPFDHPLIDPRYLKNEEDMKTFLKMVQKVRKFTETDAMRGIGVNFDNKTPFYKICEHTTYGSDAFWNCYIRHFSLTIYHPTSTCRMGAVSDGTAVVDPQLRVKGVSGLRVVDASVMRNIPSGNTNLPAIMIAEKAADLIKGVDSVSKIRERLTHNI